MKKKTTKKLAPKSEFFDLDQVLEIAVNMKDGDEFKSITWVYENGKIHREEVHAIDGKTTFASSPKGKGFIYYEHKNGKWS